MILFLLVLPLYSLDCTSSSQIFLWEFKACDRCKPSYLLGTAHIPSSLVWDRLSPLVMQALSRTQVFFGEIDSKSADSTCLKQPEYSLKTLLTETSKKAVIDTLESSGLSQAAQLYSQVEDYQWRIALSQLGSALLTYKQKADKSDPVFDMKLQDYMRAKGVTVGGIESVDEQCRLFDAETKDPEVVNSEALLFTETVNEDIESTLNMYLCHSEFLSINLDFFTDEQLKASKLDKSMQDRIRDADQPLMDALLTKRNAVMADRIVSKVLESKRKVFTFAFGAAHFLSANSVVDLLKAKGIPIVQVTTEDTIPTDSLIKAAEIVKKNKDPLIVKMLYYILIFLALFGSMLVFRVIMTAGKEQQYSPVAINSEHEFITTDSDEELSLGNLVTPGRKGI